MSATPTPTPQGQPAPTPQKKSNLLAWVLGLLLIAVIVLGLGALMVARFFVRNVQVIETGGDVQIQTPAGAVKVGKPAGADPGLPVYPGATPTDTGGTVEITSPQEESVAITAARYRTSDPIYKVDEWYRERLGSDFVREGPGVMVRKKNVFGVTVKSDDTVFISEKEDILRAVVLEKKPMTVEIALIRIGKQEPQ